MTRNQALIIKSWTCPDGTGLLLFSQKPVTARQIDQARIDLVRKFQQIYKEPPYSPSMSSDPKHHRRVMKSLRKCLGSGFQILEVGKFTIT